MWGLRILVAQFLSRLGLKLYGPAEPFLKKHPIISVVLMFIVIAALIFTIAGCVTPRSNLIMGLNFSNQAPRTLIDIECNGVRSVKEGIAVCEEKSPRLAKIAVKIMPLPGRVVYSDGLKKMTDDFNYRETGWIWKRRVIDRSWVEFDIGELNSVFGDVPIAFDVQGLAKTGVINTRGAIFHRVCNDKDIPCSKLVVNYDCSGKIGNTYEGQLGSCVRMSGSAQSFSIRLKTPLYDLKEGAQISVQSGRTIWQFRHKVTALDIQRGEVKFQYPTVHDGPDLFTVNVFQWEQGILQGYHTHILIYGYSPEWTGIDRPHYYRGEFCHPFMADAMEISEGTKPGWLVDKRCVTYTGNAPQVCAYGFDRESGDMTYNCIKNGAEVRFP